MYISVLDTLARIFKSQPPIQEKLNLHVTLWPDLVNFPHFIEFANDNRLAGIRLNSAMISSAEIDEGLEVLRKVPTTAPLYFDIKARQLRVVEAIYYKDHLELEMNHAITVDTPQVVLFKAGNDRAVLKEVKNGTRLIFEGGQPHYKVKAGESLHIRHHSLIVHEPIFTDLEVEKVDKIIAAGFKKYYLSYVEDQKEIDWLRNKIGPDAELVLKIESERGLDFALNRWVKTPNTRLMAARGDLYVELEKPHLILNAVKALLKKDPEALVGSRILLSCIHSPVPECDDFSDLAWIKEIGCRNYLLCDELCLKGELLGRAVNVFDAFRKSYV